MTNISLKQNVQWLRTLCSFIDEGSFITSVDVQSRGDTVTVSLVARQREGNKTETTAVYHHLRNALNRWQRKTVSPSRGDSARTEE